MKCMDAKGFRELLKLYAKLLSWSAWAAIAKCHRPGGLNDRHLFLTVLKAGKYKVKVPADSGPGEGPLSSLRKAAFVL